MKPCKYYLFKISSKEHLQILVHTGATLCRDAWVQFQMFFFSYILHKRINLYEFLTFCFDCYEQWAKPQTIGIPIKTSPASLALPRSHLFHIVRAVSFFLVHLYFCFSFFRSVCVLLFFAALNRELNRPRTEYNMSEYHCGQTTNRCCDWNSKWNLSSPFCVCNEICDSFDWFCFG